MKAAKKELVTELQEVKQQKEALQKKLTNERSTNAALKVHVYQ